MKGMCDMELNKVNKKVEDIKNNDNIFSVGKVIKVMFFLWSEPLAACS